jgi:hypothetical protein
MSGIDLSLMQMIGNNINMLTIHYYIGSNQSASMSQFMTFDPALQSLAGQASQYVKPYNLPYRLTECNSFYGGGAPGISNAFAASLWGSEFLFYLAQQGAAGINFHSGNPPDCVYSAINTTNNGTGAVALPLYYALLLFHQANINQFTNNELINTTNLNMDAYSFTTKDNKNGILVINKDASDLSITIKTSNFIQTVTTYELNGPSLASLTGTNINGATVNADGTFNVNGQQYSISKQYQSILAKVKHTSAMLFILD